MSRPPTVAPVRLGCAWPVPRGFPYAPLRFGFGAEPDVEPVPPDVVPRYVLEPEAEPSVRLYAPPE
ncbi:hypothetical protein MCC01975_08630 [Bifidobacteriaceae bacterium MCC01975]|nr:hypothetical protein MCC01975_08630 [Bifidobacteriaceae bacterium MCC01975]